MGLLVKPQPIDYIFFERQQFFAALEYFAHTIQQP